jgi:hypothetical protein
VGKHTLGSQKEFIQSVEVCDEWLLVFEHVVCYACDLGDLWIEHVLGVAKEFKAINLNELFSKLDRTEFNNLGLHVKIRTFRFGQTCGF